MKSGASVDEPVSAQLDGVGMSGERPPERCDAHQRASEFCCEAPLELEFAVAGPVEGAPPVGGFATPEDCESQVRIFVPPPP